MPVIAPEAQAIIDRLGAVSHERPVIDRVTVERALHLHLERLNLKPLPVKWVSDAETGFSVVLRAAESAAWSAAESAAWSAAESAARSAAWSAARSAARSAAPTPPELEKWIGIWMPFVDAYEAGLWLFWVCETEIVAVPRPSLFVQGERLHRDDGPAVHWPGGASYYFWRGVQVPETVIMCPDALLPGAITAEPNSEIRRVMLERFGAARYIEAIGAKREQADDFGELYRIHRDDDSDLVMVKVINATPEPDGTFHEYWLRVRPDCESAHEAVAWSFGKDLPRYAPHVQT